MGAPRVQHCRWVTDVRVSTRPVFPLLRAGRARWKIANETLHTLQNPGDHCAHNSGHGERQRSVVVALRRRLACLVAQTPQRGCAWLQAVWTTLGSTRLGWERMRALFSDEALTSMRQWFAALWYGFQKSRPLGMLDATSFPLPRGGHRGAGMRQGHHSAGDLRPAYACRPSSTCYRAREDCGQTCRKAQQRAKRPKNRGH